MKKKMFGAGLLAMISAAVVLAACPGNAKPPNGYMIEGNIPGLADGTCIAVAFGEGDAFHIDSGIVKSGLFTIKGEMLIPARAVLQVRSGEVVAPRNSAAVSMGEDEVDKQMFYLEKGVTKVSGDKSIATATITGTKAQADYLEFISFLQAPKDSLDAIVKIQMEFIQQNNESEIQKNIPTLRSLRMRIDEMERQFVVTHPDSYVSLQLVADYMPKDPSYEALFVGLSNELKNTPAGKLLGEQVALSDHTAPGKPAIGFTQNDPNGKPVSLSTYKGKFVLIDFWASWCKPCRAENPTLIKAYKQFRNKNFEVIGISLDDKKAPWLDAIKADVLPWVHISDLKGWKNEIAVAYNIKSIPQNFLIGPDGMIIAKNIKGEELIKTLEQVLNQ